MDKLILRELHFVARHGVLPIETENSQHFSATLELELPLGPAGTADRLDQTIDYCAVQAVVREIIEGSHKRLIETLAQQLCWTLLDHFAEMEIVSVTVHKPEAPIGGTFADVGITMKRSRAQLSKDHM